MTEAPQLPAIKLPSLPAASAQPPALPTAVSVPAQPLVLPPNPSLPAKPQTDIVDGKWRQLPSTTKPVAQPTPAPQMLVASEVRPRRTTTLAKPQRATQSSQQAAPPTYRAAGGWSPFGLLDGLFDALAGLTGFLSLDWLFGPSGGRYTAHKPVPLVYYAVPLDDKPIVVQRLLMDEVRLRPEEAIESDGRGEMSQFIFSVPVYHVGTTERALVALKIEWSRHA